MDSIQPKLPRFPKTRPPKANQFVAEQVVVERKQQTKKKHVNPQASIKFKVAPKNAHTEFRRFYDRGDIPVTLLHTTYKNQIRWLVDITYINYERYLPLFFDGLREKEEPYRFFARKGTWHLLKSGGNKVMQCIPQVIKPLKLALDTRDAEILPVALRTMQKLVKSSELAGETLIPFYRQLLPVLNEFALCNINIGDGIEYGQQKKVNIGDLVQETLEVLELNGGPEAFINIQYMVPTYQSAKSPEEE